MIDSSALNDAEHRLRMEEEIKNKLIAENQIDVQKEREKVLLEIEQARKELATIPTRLEKQDFEEPIVLQEEEERNKEWWEKLHLSGDPFPLAEGLKQISDNMYESIIVKTKIFGKYVDYANNKRDQIFKNTIIYGEFGSGKTAFFDYLRKILLHNRILSVYVQLWPGTDAQATIYNFHQAFIMELVKECKKLSIENFEIDFKNHFQTINNILSNLIERGTFNGLVIFIDDLHKDRSSLSYILDFLSYLQIFTSQHQSDAFKIAAYVAGIPQWKTRISTEPRLSGSLIRDESMPDISEADAFEMLNKRMATFAKNHDKKNINIIGKSFVHDVYVHLINNYPVITFRYFIKKVIEEFTNGNFDKVLSVNPRAIPSETISSIRKILLDNPKLGIQFEQLLALISNASPENRNNCFDVLGIVFLEKGIDENSPLGERNSWALQQLERSGLLHYGSSSSSTQWIVNKELRDANQKILNEYGVSMEDFLIPCFIGSDRPLRRRITKSPEIIILENIAKNNKSQIEQEMLKTTIQSCKNLLDADVANIAADELVSRCLESMSIFTRTFSVIEKITTDSNDNIQIVRFWKTFWYTSPSTIEFVNQIENTEKPDLVRAHFIFGLYRDSLNDLVNFLDSQLKKDSIFSIPYKDLTNEDCKIIDECRDLWLKIEYYPMCSKMTNYIENKLRHHVFNLMLLVCGYRENRMKKFDQNEIRRRIFENMKKDETKGLTAVENELQYLDRKDYKFFMTKGSTTQDNKTGKQNWNEIFSYVFAPWEEDDLLRYLDKFADFNTAVSHNKTESITALQQPDLRQFVMDSIVFLQHLNSFYRKIISNQMILKDKKFYFSFKQQVDSYNQNDVDVSIEEFHRLLNRMTGLDEITIRLDDRNSIEALYNLEYRKFIAIVNLLLNIDDERIRKIGKKLIILKDMTPLFHFKLIPAIN